MRAHQLEFSAMAHTVELLAVLCVILRIVKGATVSLNGSDTCQNFTIEEDYDASQPLVLCCLV